ncbi:MAG: hypothetical protein H6Q74_1203 [Firmicutes bacterium]|nr:hypothetical protein [Bacillota bacterium]
MSSSTVVTAFYQSGGTVVTEDQVFISSETDEYGIYVADGGNLTITDSTVTKTGDTSNSGNSSSYGLNAGILAVDAGVISLSDSTVTTSGEGANGIFATGTGSTISLTDVTIKCTGDFGHGVDVTDGGIMTLENVTISTKGAHSAAIATDTGGGTVTVNGGTAKTSGYLSPGLYSTGVIKVTGATISATGAEGAAMDGANYLVLTDTSLTAAKRWGVSLFNTQGDISGAGTFTMTGGDLTAKVGPLFYVTNAIAEITLNNVTATAKSGTIIKAAAGDWGTSGANGGTVTFTADAQVISGDVVADAISSVTVILQNDSTLTGAINNANTAKLIAVKLDATSKWSVTGTSYISTLSDADSLLANIDDNGFTIYYDASLSGNSWLNAATYTLTDGGKLTPQ